MLELATATEKRNEIAFSFYFNATKNVKSAGGGAGFLSSRELGGSAKNDDDEPRLSLE